MADELKPGQVLGETYRLVEIIGKGGMGEVWRARHERLPKEVAVKVLNASTLGDETSLARFRREAEIATRLGHPNIVGVLDFNTLPGGNPYMVMELLEGESLRDRMRRGRMPLAEVTRILRQVGAALAEAHRQGVVHRDLKPENVFLVPEPGDEGPVERAKVLDFGISKIQGGGTALTQEAEVLGTPVYMAPEQAAGRLGTVSGATDQYALAAIAYEALSGVVAFSGHTLIEVLARILEDDPAPLEERAPGLPEHVYESVRRALSKRPTERFESVTAFAEAFSGGRAVSQLQPALLATGVGTAAKGSAVGSSPGQVGAGVTAEDDQEGAFARTLASAPSLPALAQSGKLAALPSAAAPPSAAIAVSAAAPLSSSPGDPTPAGNAIPPEQALGLGPPVPRAGSAPSIDARPTYSHPTTSAGEALAGLPTKDPSRRRIGLALAAFAVVVVALGVVLLLVLGPGKDPGRRDPRGRGDDLAAARSGEGQDGAIEGRVSPRPRVSDASAPMVPRDAALAASGDRDAGGAASLVARPRPHEDPTARLPPAGPSRPGEPGRVAPPERRPPPGPGEAQPQAAERLREARAAIGRGDWATAHRAAQASLMHQRTLLAYLYMTLAHCGQKDLRLARATLRHLSGGLRRRALVWCQARGMELVEK